METTDYKEVLVELKKAALLGELSCVEKIAEQLENVLQNILEVNSIFIFTNPLVQADNVYV